MAPKERKHRFFSGADRFTICVGLLALIVGAALLAVSRSFLLSIAGACLLGLAAVAFVALAFLMVGESEDRDYNHHNA
jgi:MFS family permease